MKETRLRLEEALPAVEAAAEEALQHAGRFEAGIEVAGLSVRLRFAGVALYDKMGRAFRHLPRPTSAPDLDVVVWDSASSGVGLPEALGPIDGHYRRGLAQLEQTGPVLSLFEGIDRGLSLLDTRRNAAVYWIPDARAASEGDRGTPLRTVFNWWLPSKGLQLLHAAALATPAGAVLLFGRGGVGKSTTALTAAAAGFSYLSDDMCAVAMEPEPRAHSVYCSGKVFEHNLDRLPRFDALVTNRDDLEREKAIGYLDELETPALALSAKVRAGVLLTAKGEPAPVIERLTPAKALVGIAPSSLLNLPSPGNERLKALSAFVNRVPCFEMRLAEDRSANPEALRLLLDGLEAGG